MPSAAEVNPEKWSDIAVLFDNGRYSVIAGVYEHGERVLGERWNGDRNKPLGFPNVAGYSIWHVPDFLAVPILHGLLVELARIRNPPNTPKRFSAKRIVQQISTTHLRLPSCILARIRELFGR